MFKHAIVRKPGENFSEGVTASNLGKPDYRRALEQHDAYCKVLKKCGLELMILEPDPKYPDGVFIEDTAIVTERYAIMALPGEVTRQGEEGSIKGMLSHFRAIEHAIELPGTLDGGDVLRVEYHFYIGLSRRTNKEGAKQLSSILAGYGYTSSIIPVKNGLHLKTGVTYIKDNNLIAIEEFYDRKEFRSFNIVKVDKEENYSANCLLANNFLLVPKGFPKTKKKLSRLGYKLIELEMSEFQKMDGGLTCLSLLF